jgi:VIT1/CCC1 family predicted Fe2+/Mn2+ transporter
VRGSARARHLEGHRSARGGWLRAAVLGSDDAIVSTASLLLGVAGASTTEHAVLVAGLAGLVAGASSMAVGEYVSVSSQRDAERADVAKETAELAKDPAAELVELTAIYVKRGLEPKLAGAVATALMSKDALAAHLRDELGLDAASGAKPVQAALVSAASFALFALVPVSGVLAPIAWREFAVAGLSLSSLAALGALGGWLGGASKVRAALRVTVGGALAMAIGSAVGHLMGA